MITCLTCSFGQSIFNVLNLDKLEYSNPLWSGNFDRDSITLNKVLQYYNWTDNQVKTECLSPPVRQKSILKIVKLTKIANFSIESWSESGSSFIRPLKKCEWYTNINFHEILLITHSLLKFLRIWTNWTSFTGIWILKKWQIWSIFQKYAHVPDRCGPTKNVIEKKTSCPATAHVGLTEKHKVGNIWSRVWPAALANEFLCLKFRQTSIFKSPLKCQFWSRFLQTA